MKALILQRARELGFDDCRISPAEPPTGASALEFWLRDGRQGEMAWLARNAHKRMDPQQVLNGVRSVVCLAANYGLREGRPSAAAESALAGNVPFSGVVARYARHTDYHELLAGPLQQLTAFINELGGPRTRSLWYVDTGPILERDFAQRAGIGFIGKHTNLISRKFGNWIVLAEILTTLELEPDVPERNRCGHCTRCIEVCPTRAITAPFQLDARRCISYLTIELKGSIPVELRPAIGDRIFGCDDCLEACPWNRFAHEGSWMRTHHRPDLATPGLLELLALDEPAFKRRFAGTPILRAKRRGLLRNVCVALGNVGDRNALPALQQAVADPEPVIAEHASWAIRQVQSRHLE